MVTGMKVKSLIASGALTLFPSFSLASDRPTDLESQATRIPPSCTVRLNRYNDSEPDDIRYIGTKYEDLIKSNGSFSGITYTQSMPLESNTEKFKFTSKEPIDHLDKSFRSAVEISGRYKGKEYTYDQEYYEANEADRKYGQGVIINSQYANWTQSYEADINNPESCLAIRHKLSSWAPDYRTLYNFFLGSSDTHTSDSFADAVWAYTGLPSNDEDLRKNPAVRIITREERLKDPRYQFDKQQALPPPILEK